MGRGAEWTQFGLHHPICELKKIVVVWPGDLTILKPNKRGEGGVGGRTGL
jgi:hypothetical protein